MAPSNPPPPYSNSSTNAQKLRESFSHLVNNQADIQILFKSVAGQLENAKEIGEGHPLCIEWNQLRQTHRKLYRDSQQNASQCASFLDNYAAILVPLSQSSMTMPQKKFMINKFLEAVPVHLSCASSNTERFHELGKQIEGFGLKVASTLRVKAESANFLENLWTNFEELCMSLWQTLRKLLMEIVHSFKQMLSRMQTIRLSCIGVSLDIQLSQMYEQLPSREPSSARSAAAQIKDDCKDLGDKLSMFEDAWHVVMLSCNELKYSMAMAKSMTPVPEACDRNMQSAAATYMPLIECLQAYATAGKRSR